MPWYYYKRGRREGPIDDSAIRRMAALGELEPTDLVWCPGMKDWAQAATVPGLLQPPPVPLQGQVDDEQAVPESSPTLPSPAPQPRFASVPPAQRQPDAGSTRELAAAQRSLGEGGACYHQVFDGNTQSGYDFKGLRTRLASCFSARSRRYFT